MQLIKVAAAVLNQTPLDWSANRQHIVDAIRAARQANVTLLCLPELCITGYGCEDAFHSTAVQRTALQLLEEIVPETSGLVVSVGLPLMYGGGLFNTACLLADGRIRGFVAKQKLAGEGIHYEPRWFKPWPAGVRVEIPLFKARYALGDWIFDVGGVKIGFEICEDAWVGDRPGTLLAARGADVILNPSASHFAFGKHEIRQRFVLEGSRALHVSYLYANLLGNEAGRAIYDGDAMIASGGHMRSTGPRFSFADFHLTTATIDVDTTRMDRARTGSYQPGVAVSREDVIDVDFELPAAKPEIATTDRDAWEEGDDVKQEEFTRAVSLGLFDYLRKSRSRGFVVSLSGGADSSTAAIMASLVVEFGVQQLGLSGLLRKLSYLGELRVQDKQQLTRQLLTCVYQSTRNSTDVTRKAARAVAEAIHADFLEFDVDDLVERYVQMVSAGIGRELTWQSDDLALQNIQARVRAPSVWMVANLRGALLLSTSNRSEAAVGYATMDGDTSGGLAPIAGIDKAFLRHWLQWIETTGPQGTGAMPALSTVNRQQPTAELRPPSLSQTDQSDLMPYDVLDTIERAAIRDKLSPVEVFQLIQPHYPQHSAAQLAQWVELFFRLWSRNQWKRERYAPSFHLDDENLDPKTWCRFPILSGGFQRELAELKRRVEDAQLS